MSKRTETEKPKIVDLVMNKGILDPYITTDQAAQRVGIDRATILRLVRTDELAGKYFGSHVRTRESWLLDWLCRPSNTGSYKIPDDLRALIEDYEARVRDALRSGACALEQIPESNSSRNARSEGPTACAVVEQTVLAAESGRIILGIEFLTVEGVAQLAAVSRAVVLSWIRRCELQAKKVGKNWLIARLWFEEFYHTPDSAPADDQDENARARGARQKLIREREQGKAQAAKKKTALGKPEGAAASVPNNTPKRKRGRPRKGRPEDEASRQDLASG